MATVSVETSWRAFAKRLKVFGNVWGARRQEGRRAEQYSRDPFSACVGEVEDSSLITHHHISHNQPSRTEPSRDLIQSYSIIDAQSKIPAMSLPTFDCPAEDFLKKDMVSSHPLAPPKPRTGGALQRLFP